MRCGVGFALMLGMHLIGGGFLALPGKQSVPRSEISALIVVLASVVFSADVELVCDALTVCETFLDGPTGKWRHSDNADLWKQVWYYLAKRTGHVVLRWVKAHCFEHPEFVALYDVEPSDVVGNFCADWFAGHAANLAELSPVDCGSSLFRIEQVRGVQRRLVAILHHVVNDFPRDEKVKQVRLPPLSWGARSLVSQHDLTKVQGMWVCRKCGVLPPPGKELTSYLASSCFNKLRLARYDFVHALQFPACQRIPKGVVVRVGGTRIHYSHKVWVKQGVFSVRYVVVMPPGELID